MHKLQVLLFVTFIALPAVSAPMSRVVRVVDSHTLVVETNGASSTIRLANVDLPPDAERDAVEWLERELVSRWVLVEPVANGAANVFRSPDSLHVNREVLQSWLDGPTQHAGTRLGVVLPAKHREVVILTPQRAAPKSAPRSTSRRTTGTRTASTRSATAAALRSFETEQE